MTATVPARSRARSRAWVLPAALALGALVVRLPAFFAPRHVGFDDGVYGVSVVGMRHGQWPFKDFFSPQGPLHFVLLRTADFVGFQTLNAPRLASVGAGIGATLATYAAARRLKPGSRWGPALAAALVATSGTMLWTTGPITGDGMAVAFSLAAVAGALEYRDRPRPAIAILTGLAMGAALLVKAIVFPAVIPVGWWLWSPRRARDFALAVGTAIALGVIATVPFGFDRVYDQSVSYHREAGYLYGPAEQIEKLVTTLISRDLPLLVALGLGLVFAVRRGPHARRVDPDTMVLLVWLGTGVLTLTFEPSMFRNHIASVIGPLALLVALRPPPLRWISAAALVLVVPWSIAHLSDVRWPGNYRGDEARVVDALRDLPDGAQVISDEPGFVWRAGKYTPPQLNDASIKRIQIGDITTEKLADAAARPEVCAVVVWSSRFGRELPGLPDALQRAGLEPAETYGGFRTLWRKPECNP